MARHNWLVIVGVAVLAIGGGNLSVRSEDAKSASKTAGAPSNDADAKKEKSASATEAADPANTQDDEKESSAKDAKRGDAATAARAVDSKDAVELFGGVKDGKLEMKFIAKNDHEARVLLTNKTKQPMTVKLPAAFAGVPYLAQQRNGGGGNRTNNSTNNQNQNQGVGGGFGGGGLGGGGGGFGGGGGGFFSVPPEQTAKIEVEVVCLDHGLRDPSSSKLYEMVPVEQYVDRPAVVELIKALGRGELQHGAAQAAAWHLNNDLSWGELAAKRQGTERSIVRPPYFSGYEIQAGMAYSTEAGRRGQLAMLERQRAEMNGAAAPDESSDAKSTAADGSREPAAAAKSNDSEAKSDVKAEGVDARKATQKTSKAANTKDVSAKQP